MFASVAAVDAVRIGYDAVTKIAAKHNVSICYGLDGFSVRRLFRNLRSWTGTRDLAENNSRLERVRVEIEDARVQRVLAHRPPGGFSRTADAFAIVSSSVFIP